jgi:hypothetical protein
MRVIKSKAYSTDQTNGLSVEDRRRNTKEEYSWKRILVNWKERE